MLLWINVLQSFKSEILQLIGKLDETSCVDQSENVSTDAEDENDKKNDAKHSLALALDISSKTVEPKLSYNLLTVDVKCVAMSVCVKERSNLVSKFQPFAGAGVSVTI